MRRHSVRWLGPAALLLAASAATAEPPGTADGPRVKLLAPGKAPLRALRYSAKEGQAGAMTMSLIMSMEMSLASQALPAQNIPEVRYGLAYKVTKVEPQGDIRYEFELKDPQVVAGVGVAPMVLDTMKAAMDKMRGLRGHAVVTSRGLVREADVQEPEGADAQLRQMLDGMRQSMNQLAAPFPEEPVGVGARWETALRITQNSITLDQVTVSDLASLEGDSGKLQITLTQKADPQKVQPKNMPPGAYLNLASLDSTGSGETAFDLRQLVPVKAEIKMHSEMKAGLKLGPDEQPMGMKMDMTMSLTGK
ncbi:MAG TPA: hypothetical protein VF310_13925 [Vicinamibacteria bacterium]